MNNDCLYLHEKADPSDCFPRRRMTICDKEFYQKTHPGHGSVWDPVQRLFVYQRHGSSRYAGSHNELPPAHGTNDEKQETMDCLRLYPEGFRESPSANSAMYQFGLKKRFDGSDSALPCKMKTPITEDTDILFQWPRVVPVSQVHSEEPPGQNVDLDELFGTASNNK